MEKNLKVKRHEKNPTAFADASLSAGLFTPRCSSDGVEPVASATPLTPLLPTETETPTLAL
jgi:hypothetical protein